MWSNAIEYLEKKTLHRMVREGFSEEETISS